MHVERAFVICLHFFLAVYVQLQCPAGEWIHVEHEVYGDGDADTCRLKSAESCSKKLDRSQFGLVVNCNGKQSCFEAMQVQPIDNCNVTDAAAEVQYNCIKGSMNMCSPVTTTVNGSVYLHSPGFPDSVGVNSSCVIRITGQTLQVTLVEQWMRSGILNISGDGRQLWTYVYVNQYNRILPEQAAELAIVYDNHDQDGSNLWIKVADSGQMNITISGETLNASTTPTSTQQPSQNTSGPSTSDTPTTETAASTHSTAIASFTAVTSTHGLTTHSSTNNAAQWPSTSTTVSTAVSTTETNQSTETVTGDPTTNTTTAVTTPKSTTALTTPKSATIITTKGGEASSTTTSSPGPGLIVSAVSGCVVTILIVVIAVVLCRKHVKKSRPLETPGKGHFERPSELSSINEQDQYAKALTLGSTVDMNDKSTFAVTNSEADNRAPNVIRDPNGGMADNDHPGICGMTENYFHSKQVWKSNCEMIENDVYDGGPPHAANENNVDDSYGVGLETNVGMVDNGLYDKFDFDRQKESVQDESDTSPNNSKQSWKDDCEMIENNVHDGGPPHLDDPVGSMADNDNPVGDLYDGGLETSEGMVDNGLYDKCKYDREKDSLQDESETSARKSKQAWKNDCAMVENDVYERGPL